MNEKTLGSKNDSLIKKFTKFCASYSFILIFIAIFIIYMISSSGLTWNGIMNILRHSGVIGIVALGMGLIIITGDIDLSIGSALAFVGGVSVMMFNITNSILLTLLFAIFFGGLCGLFNGILVGKAKMPAFIVTLATMLIYRSLAQYICKTVSSELSGGSNSLYKLSKEMSKYQNFYDFGNGKAFTVPVVGIFLVILTMVVVYLTNCTKYGKSLYAIGSNEGAARLAGANVERIRIVVFVIAGIFVGIGAFLWIAMNASVDPATTGNSYEMFAIAAVVLGGISMSGGRGKCMGILFGAMSYTVIDKIIVSLKMDSLINNAVKGIILIVAILVQTMGPQIKAKLKARSKK